MESSNSKINNKEWLARDAWDAIDAACFFAQIDVNAHIKVYLHGDALNHPKAKKYLGTTKTWAISAPPLWFINKAVEEGFPEISEVILNDVREYVERRLLYDDKFLKDYRGIAHKLNVPITNQDDNPLIESESIDGAEYSWVPNARNVYEELKVDGIKLYKSNLNMEQRAEKVKAEMEKRFAAGDKTMAKRGGKEVPSSDTIRRHALQNLEK